MIDGMAFPWWGPVVDPGVVAAGGRGGWLYKVGEHEVLRPAPGVARVARRWMTPTSVVAGFVSTGLGTRASQSETRMTWGLLPGLACTGLLAVAVAFRQNGHFLRHVAAQIGLIVGRADWAAARAVVAELARGRPEWGALPPEEATEARAFLDALDGKVELDTPRDRAVAAMRAGRADTIPELIKNEPEDDLETAIFHAYALDDTGDTDGAMAVLLPFIRGVAMLGRHDQCELLHCLGAVAETAGKLDLAVRHFLDERSLSPPDPQPRLHNRIHLLNVLDGWSGSSDGLPITIAEEAIELALEHAGADEQRTLIRRWARLAIAARGERVAAFAEQLARSDVASELPSVSLVRVVQGPWPTNPGERMDILRRIADGNDWEAAFGCLFYADLEGVAPDERVTMLWRGTEMSDSMASALCLRRLLQELWEQDEDGEYERAARALIELAPSLGHAGLAALAVKTGDREAALRRLTQALADWDATQVSAGLAPSIRQKIPRELWSEANLAAIRTVWRKIDALLSSDAGDEQLGPLIGRALTVFDGAGDPSTHVSMVRNDARLLTRTSERLWDRGSLELSARCRATACRLFATIDDRRDLAVETSWLAALQRARGELAEAESLYTQAIEIGRSSLDGQTLGGMIGRYGSLLHDTGDFDAAIEVKWRGLCTYCPRTNDSAPFSSNALLELLRWTPDTEATTWIIHLANYANCLIDGRNTPLAHDLIERARDLMLHVRDSGATADRNQPFAEEIIARVTYRLEP